MDFSLQSNPSGANAKGLCNQKPKYESFPEKYSKSNRVSRLIYAKLISKKSIVPTQNQQKNSLRIATKTAKISIGVKPTC